MRGFEKISFAEFRKALGMIKNYIKNIIYLGEVLNIVLDMIFWQLKIM